MATDYELRELSNGPESETNLVSGTQTLFDVASRELLHDQNCDDASAQDRKDRIGENTDEITKALLATADGGTVRSPFDRIVLKGIK